MPRSFAKETPAIIAIDAALRFAHGSRDFRHADGGMLAPPASTQVVSPAVRS